MRRIASAVRFVGTRAMLRGALLGCCGLLALSAVGQNSDATLERELGRLAAVADDLDHALPSFTCKESGTSERWSGKTMLQQMKFSATLRAKPSDEGGLEETYLLTDIDGHPYNPYLGSPLPLYVAGGFDMGMRYFAHEWNACYKYTLTPERIDFVTAKDWKQHQGCIDEKMQGFALLDGDGNVTHLERHVGGKEAEQRRYIPFASIDFAPVDLNGKTFWLSQHMISEVTEGRAKARFDVTYADCHRFAATVTIGPATTIEPEAAPVPAPEPTK